MKKLFLVLIVSIVTSFTVLANEGNDLQAKIDSLSYQVAQLNEKVTSLNHDFTYQNLLQEIKSIIDKSSILENSIDILDEELLIFKIHEQLSRKAKKVFQKRLQLLEDNVDLNDTALNNWKVFFELYNTMNYFTEEEVNTLNNRYLAAQIHSKVYLIL